MPPRILRIICLLLFSTVFDTAAQVSVRDSSISFFMLKPSYSFQVPEADMAKRFGINSAVGISALYKHKSNWMFSAEWSYIFGNRISEEGLFRDLANDRGYIVGKDGFYADIRTFERGYYAMLSVGRLFPFKKPNPNSGLFAQVGAGFIQHKIKIVDKKNAVPALQEPYVKGYDRLTNGFALREFFGYMYIGNQRLVNFYGGLEFIQGFTAGRRSYNYDQQKADNSQRLDLLFGLRVGWIIPFYKEAAEKFYTY